jgi:hypothetical protein
MTDAVTREQLHAYLDEALTDAEAARVEQALRQSGPLKDLLRQVMQERDRGDHSLGSVWRRERLTCPGRDRLRTYLLGALDEGEEGYIRFHLDAVACPFCLANLHDIEAEAKRQAQAPETRARRRKLFEASARHLDAARREPR